MRRTSRARARSRRTNRLTARPHRAKRRRRRIRHRKPRPMLPSPSQNRNPNRRPKPKHPQLLLLRALAQQPLDMALRMTKSLPLKRYLVAGLLVWVPLGITIWVLHFLVTTLDQTLLLFPESARPEALFGFRVPGLGVLISFAILLLTGVIAANFVGARLIGF